MPVDICPGFFLSSKRSDLNKSFPAPPHMTVSLSFIGLSSHHLTIRSERRGKTTQEPSCPQTFLGCAGLPDAVWLSCLSPCQGLKGRVLPRGLPPTLGLFFFSAEPAAVPGLCVRTRHCGCENERGARAFSWVSVFLLHDPEKDKPELSCFQRAKSRW